MLWRGRPFLPPQAMPTGCLWTDVSPLSSSSFDARYAAKAVIKTPASLRRRQASRCRSIPKPRRSVNVVERSLERETKSLT